MARLSKAAARAAAPLRAPSTLRVADRSPRARKSRTLSCRSGVVPHVMRGEDAARRAAVRSSRSLGRLTSKATWTSWPAAASPASASS